MHLDLLLRYPAPPADVAALLADAPFVEALCASGGASEYTVAVDGDPAGAFTVTVERSLPTSGMPDVAARFVGPSLRLRQVDAWEAPAADGSRSGTILLEVVGAPVRARAATALRPAPGGCEQPVTGELTASVPLVGARVEKAAAPPLVAALHEQAALAATRLSAR